MLATPVMRNIIAIAALLLTLTACTQETETTATVSDTGTTESSTTTVSATVPEIDTAATAEATRDAAYETGTALETAGKELQKTKTD